MTEQTTHGGFVEDVGSLFSAYVEQEDGRECIGGGLANLGPEEAARQFTRAERFFLGVVMAAEQLDYGIYLSACEAMDTARKARKVAENYVREESD
jgi:hypothetical protein